MVIIEELYIILQFIRYKNIPNVSLKEASELIGNDFSEMEHTIEL